mgnify:CR=1 FL=1
MTKPKFDVDIYEEQYWEILDKANARIIAHFFDADYAQAYLKFLNDTHVEHPEV